MRNMWKRLIVFLGLCAVAVSTSGVHADAISPSVLLVVADYSRSPNVDYYSSTVNGFFKHVFSSTTSDLRGISPDNHYIIYQTGVNNRFQVVVQDILSGKLYSTDITEFQDAVSHFALEVEVLPSQNPQLWSLCWSYSINTPANTDDRLADKSPYRFIFMNRQTHLMSLSITISHYLKCVLTGSELMSPDGNSWMSFGDCDNTFFTDFNTQLSYFHTIYAPLPTAESGGCYELQPYGRYLWTADSQNIIGIRELEIVLYNAYFMRHTSQPTPLMKLDNPADLLDWQPKHNAFLFAMHIKDKDKLVQKLFSFNMTTRIATELPNLGIYPRWSPSGQYIAGTHLSTDAVGKPRFDVVVYDVEHATITPITSDQPGSTCNPQWSPDGTWIAYDLVDAQQGDKTGCFNPHGVAAIHWLTHTDWVLLSQQSPQPVTLVGWVQP